MKQLSREPRRKSIIGIFAASVMTIVAACGTDVGPAPAPELAQAAVDAPQANSPRDPKGLRANYIETVQSRASAVYAAAMTNGTAQLRNPTQQFHATIDRQGLVVSASREAWHVAMHTRAVGCVDATKPVAEAALSANENRVTLGRDDLDEWYLNGPLGVEQGFVLREAPACAGPKVVVMGVEGDVAARLDDEDGDGRGDAVRFVDDEGQEKLAYTDLVVKDATGKTLPAALSAVAGEVSITVDDVGAQYPLTIDPLIWTQEQKLTPTSNMFNDVLFGTSVSLSGNTALVGAPGDDTRGFDAGGAYVFVRSGTMWSAQATLSPSTLAIGDLFGNAVAVAGDTAVVGVPGDDVGANSDQGSVYVFVRNGTMWTEQARLFANDGANGDQFGFSVAISGDSLVVGAPSANVGANADQGAAYVFTRSGTMWTQAAKVVASDGATNAQLGYSVAVSAGTVVAGAHNASIGMTTFQGATYVFESNGMGGWPQQAKLVASDGAANDDFGASVSVSADTAVVGARYANDMLSDTGKAYVFTRSGTVWTEQAKLQAGDGLDLDYFGSSVSVVGDQALIGTPGDNDLGEDSGTAYVFTRSGTTWTQTAKFTALDNAAGDQFGYSVSLGTDTALVGAPYHTNGAFINQGAAYVHFGKKAAGDSCTAATECATGFCADGVCCDTACGGGDPTDCQACAVAAGAGTNGTCAPTAAMTVCRMAAGACDVAEVCNGTNVACPADVKVASGTECRASAGMCDVAETCDGTNAACPSDMKAMSGTECRASAGDCDVAEVCDGTSVDCPANAKVNAGTECRASVGMCDAPENCNGVTNDCPADAKVTQGAECRPSAGGCDPAEACDGTTNDCPADGKIAAGTECRAAFGECDVAEACDGTNDECPGDAKAVSGTECRAAAGACDVAETCDGMHGACPADEKVVAGIECRKSVGPCDAPDTCDGVADDCPADAKFGADIVCRSAVGECDVKESCDGQANECPSDVLVSDGTTCANGVCTGGICKGEGGSGGGGGNQELPPILTGGGIECSVAHTAPTNSSPASLGIFAMALLALRRRFSRFQARR